MFQCGRKSPVRMVWNAPCEALANTEEGYIAATDNLTGVHTWALLYLFVRIIQEQRKTTLNSAVKRALCYIITPHKNILHFATGTHKS